MCRCNLINSISKLYKFGATELATFEGRFDPYCVNEGKGRIRTQVQR